MKMKRLISFFCVMICMLAWTLPAFAEQVTSWKTIGWKLEPLTDRF